MNAKEAYETLIIKVKKLSYILSARSLLAWDQRTYMPRKAIEFRSKQFSAFAEYEHRFITSEEFAKLLSKAEEGNWPKDSHERMNLFWLRRAHDRMVKIPLDLQLRLVRKSAETEVIWREAKRKEDATLILPHLSEIVSLKREVARHLGYSDEPYDALLDSYEPGLKAKEVERIFYKIKGEILRLLRKVRNSSKKAPVHLIHGHFPAETQREFNLFILKSIGYDLEAGRLDETTHPFAIRVTPKDVRITTRYKENDITDAIFSTLHEMGHALYNSNLPEEWFGEPVGSAASLSIHESQSRFWENIVGRSFSFWKVFYPFLRAFFPYFWEVSLEDFVFAINGIKPSFIRIEADELTYNLHIVLRFELERALINGELDVKDLPDRWDEKFKELFGIEPRKPSEGFLQDIHWYSGSFGYFPTYTLGNIIAAQLLAKMIQEMDLYELIERGEFKPIVEWLKDRVHRHGSLFLTSELVEKATGEPLNPTHLIGYLSQKVETFYG
ncbi:MAG: carboxypeptidase M32 [Thermotogae bacterium]|nr:carboxypeptidase M32 [Thermotogota bacterium]